MKPSLKHIPGDITLTIAESENKNHAISRKFRIMLFTHSRQEKASTWGLLGGRSQIVLHSRGWSTIG